VGGADALILDDRLSVLAAARDAGAAVALHTDGACWTFAELAQRVGRRAAELEESGCGPYPLVGTNAFDTLITLLALLELRRPALLLHPKLSPAERAREIEATAAAAAALPDDAAVILYTSGTTGRARGAILTRSALLASAAASAANLGWQDDDRWLLAMPLARIGGLSIVTRCLATRRTVVLTPGFDAARLPQWIEQHRVTLASLVPTMLTQVLDAHPDWIAPAHFRALLLGGAAAAPALLDRARERRLPIVVTYGCTETCSQVVATPYAQRFDAGACGAGRPLTDAQLRIDRGHILVRGPMRMAGYLGEAPLAADEWFDTGDLGALDAAGCLHLRARRVDLIVSGGENVYPAEVERVLESCPGVRAAAVFGVDDNLWGQVVAAVLVADSAHGAQLMQSLDAILRSRLAPHQRPRRVALVDSLPLTPGGKLDRAALPALAGRLGPVSR
jgi:O-succinylbenzoic acid--CoA ligase